MTCVHLVILLMPPKRTYSELSLLIATVSILVTVTIAMPSEFEDHQQVQVINLICFYVIF